MQKSGENGTINENTIFIITGTGRLRHVNKTHIYFSDIRKKSQSNRKKNKNSWTNTTKLHETW